MKKRWDAVTVGEIYSDHVFSGLLKWPQPGEEVFTRNYLRELGGGGAITACGLSLLGRRTAAFGVIGHAEADWIKQRFEEFGVETDGLLLVPSNSGVTLSVSVGDERSFYSYAGSNDLLGDYLSSKELLGHICEAAHVHFAVPLSRSVAETVLPSLKAANCTVSLDVGWQPEWYLDPENLQTCREVDYFLPNCKEAEYLTGHQHPEHILLGLEQLGFTHIVVKLGREGTAIHHKGSMLQVPSPHVNVVDTTGAGDAFDAGFIDALLDGAEPIELLRRAAECGALSTRAVGALNGLATRQDVESIYAQS